MKAEATPAAEEGEEGGEDAGWLAHAGQPRVKQPQSGGAAAQGD